MIEETTIRESPIQRPPLIKVPFSSPDFKELLREPAYVGLSAANWRPIARVIMDITASPYAHAFLISRGVSGDFLLTESTALARKWSCFPTGSQEDKENGGDGVIDIFKIKGNGNLQAAWDSSLLCAGEPYAYSDLTYVWLHRFRQPKCKQEEEFRIVEDNPEPKGCSRDCSCQVHAALRIHGFGPVWKDDNWPKKWQHDCMVAPRDLCEAAHPKLFEYVCTPTLG